MDLEKLTVFRMIGGRMQWLAQRQRVLAQNIANADTPDYQARDLKAAYFRKPYRANEFRLELLKTDPQHFGGGIRKSAFGAERPDRRTFETSPTGNGVILEDQQIKVAETVGNYELMTNLYRKHVGMIHTALGRNGGR